MHAATQVQADVIGNDHRVGFHHGLVAIEGDHRCADQVFGAQVGFAHALGAFDELGERPFEPGDLDNGVRVREVRQLLPLAQISVHPARDQVGNLNPVFQVVLHDFPRQGV
ncbi:hypothetical protein D3C87_1611580 [compost metagenome]